MILGFGLEGTQKSMEGDGLVSEFKMGRYPEQFRESNSHANVD